MSNCGDCSNRAYMEKMIEAATKHPPNEPATRQIAAFAAIIPQPYPSPARPSVQPQPHR